MATKQKTLHDAFYETLKDVYYALVAIHGMLWILAGVVLAGAVQDFMILFISMRRDGRSLGELIRAELGVIPACRPKISDDAPSPAANRIACASTRGRTGAPETGWRPADRRTAILMAPSPPRAPGRPSLARAAAAGPASPPARPAPRRGPPARSSPRGGRC